MQLKKIAAIVGTGAFLAACGGNGNIPRPVNNAEGFWLGATAEGADVTFVVLEDGETWGFTSTDDLLEGAIHGSLKARGSAASGSGRLYDFGNAVTQISVSGSVTPKSSLTLRTAEGLEVTAAYDKRYDQPASLTDLAGTYQGMGISGTSGGGQAIPFAVATDGSLRASVPDAACQAFGVATPRASGKNVFDLAVTFSGRDCALGEESITGVAFLDTSASPYQLIALALKDDRSDGFAWSGVKE